MPHSLSLCHIILCICFLSGHINIGWNPFPPCLTPHLPRTCKDPEGGQQGGWFAETSPNLTLHLDPLPLCLGSTGLQDSFYTHDAFLLYSPVIFLPGWCPLGTLVYRPASLYLNTSSNYFHRAEGSGQTSDSHF